MTSGLEMEWDYLGRKGGNGKNKKVDKASKKTDKNSSGDEIANENFYAVHPGSYPNSLK